MIRKKVDFYLGKKVDLKLAEIIIIVGLITEVFVRGFGYLIGRTFSYLFGKQTYNRLIIKRTPKRTKKWIKKYFADHLSDPETVDQYKDYLVRWLQAHNLSIEDLKSEKIKKTILKLVKTTKSSKNIKELLKQYKKPLKNTHSFQRWDELIERLLNSEFKDIFLFENYTEADLRIFEGIKEIVKHSYLHNLKQEKVMINTYLMVEHYFKVAESQMISIIDKLDSDIEDNLIDIMNEQQELNIIAATINQMLTTYIKDSLERQKVLDEIFYDTFYNLKQGQMDLKERLMEIKQEQIDSKQRQIEMKDGIDYLVEKAEEKPIPKEIFIKTPFTFKHLSKPISSNDELMKLENKIEFLENRLCGKFVTETGEKMLNWESLKENKILDFSWVEFPSIEERVKPLYIITGKGGAGKTTYLFYWLEKCLMSEKSWIKNIVFLNPTRETWNRKEIIEELRFFTHDNPINPDNLIIAIDALFRENDNNKSMERKIEFIKEMINNEFTVILTIKESHFEDLKEFLPEDSYWKRKLTPTYESTKNILNNWMNFYEVESVFEENSPEIEEAIKVLFEKSEEGLPYYIHHFVIMMFSKNLPFSKEIVEKVPEGMKNFIWYTIEKDLTFEDNYITYFILRTLYKQRNSLPFSFEFLKFLTEWHSSKFSKIQAEAISKLNVLKLYLLPIEFKELDGEEEESKEERKKRARDISKYSLDDVWRDCFKTRYKDKELLVRDFVSYESFNKVKESYEGVKAEFIKYARDFLELNLEKQENPGLYPLFSYILADLAKFEKEQISYCIELYNKYKDNIPWSYNNRTYIQHELALVSFLRAIEFRDEGDYINAERMAKAATELVKFKKALHFYTQILERKLRETPRENSGVLISKIEDLYNLIIDIDKEDMISWNTRAIFCKNIQQFERAEDYFNKALELAENKYVPTLQSYAIFCNEMGNFYWNIDNETAEKYFSKAEELFELGEEQASKTKFSQRELINAYAHFLEDLAGKRVDVELDKRADDKWKILIEEYGDARDKNDYANFLMKIGRRLKHRYPQKSYLKITKDLLKTNIEKFDDPYSYNILARLLYRYEQRKFVKYKEKEQIFIEALELLKSSLEKAPSARHIKYPLIHKAICNHEMAKIYMMWANYLETDERSLKLDLAIDHLKTALDGVPDNNQNYYHKMRVCYSFSILYSKYKNNIKFGIPYALQADKYARKLQWRNRTYYRMLIKMGDDSSRENIKTAIYFYKRSSELQENNYISYMRIGHCFSNLALKENFKENIEKTIDYYAKAAECETVDLYCLRYIRENLQLDLQPKLGYYRYSLLLQYLKLMQSFSEKIISEGAQISWKIGSDYLNYSEDYINVGRVIAYNNAEEAIKWFKLANEKLPILQNKIKDLFDETRFGEDTKKEMRDAIKKSHRIDSLITRWETELERIIKANRKNQLYHYYKILKFDYETCLEFNNKENARKILIEYFNVLFPLDLLNHDDIFNLGMKFLDLHENLYAYKCFKYLEREDVISLDLLQLLSEAIMKIGQFENALTLFREMLKKYDGLGNRNNINGMIKNCEEAIKIKNKISDALTSILELIQIDHPDSLEELAQKYYNVAKKILEIKKEINLYPLISIIANRRVHFRESNYLKMIIFPNKIIRSLLWKAQELGYPLSEEEEDFLNMADYKLENAKVLLYSAIQIRKEAFDAEDLVKNAKLIQAIFYHLTYLALDCIEEQKTDLDFSKKWGQTGGTLNLIDENSLIKISYSILKKCFHQSIHFNKENDRSRAHYGLLILRREGNIDGAKAIFNRCLTKDKNLLIGLGEIAQSEGDRNSARNHYLEAAEYIKQLNIDNNYKVRELTPLAEKLIMIGHPKDGLEIYEFIEPLIKEREKLLVNIKIEVIKNSWPELII